MPSTASLSRSKSRRRGGSPLTPDEHETAAAAGRPATLVNIEGLKVVFSGHGRLRSLVRSGDGVRAVDGIDLVVGEHEIVGVVGESGSGKTTLANSLLRLVPVTEGRIVFRGEDITRKRGRQLRRVRRQLQMVFQDPHSSLDPRMRVASLLNEPYVIHDVPTADRYRVADLLSMVELPARVARLYAHELSGGQARRVGIARALALKPALIVADEPTAGLDVSAASAILNLLQSLRDEHGTAYVIITHALNVVGYLADRISVMYLGRLMELGPAEEVYDRPLHPYTRALIAAIPEITNVATRRRILLEGEIPSPRNPPAGCRFHTRCPYAEQDCSEIEPALAEVAPGRYVACHHWSALGEGQPLVAQRIGMPSGLSTGSAQG